MICLTCTKKTNCAIWLSEAEARIHQDSHPKHEIGDQEPEERMTSEERASNFQRVYFRGRCVRGEEPDRLLGKVWVGFLVALWAIVFGWLIAWPLFVRDVKAVVEFWK